MDLSYLDDFEHDVQISAYEMYQELHALKELNQIELPESLTVTLSKILSSLNNQLLKNTKLKSQTKDLTEMIQKENQKRKYYEDGYRKEKQNIQTLIKESDEETKKFKEKEDNYKDTIKTLNRTIEKLEERKPANKDTPDTGEKTPINQKSVKSQPQSHTGHQILHVPASPPLHPQPHASHQTDPAPALPSTSALANGTTTSTENTNQNVVNSNNSNANHVVGNVTNGHNLFVIGDSHCRDLLPELRKYTSPDIRVNCIAMPGKKLGQIVNAIKPQKLSPSTNVCIIGGTNDVFQTTYEEMIKSYDHLYEKCRNHKIYVVLIPPRYDYKNISSHILNLNCKLKHYLEKYDNVTCIDPKNVLNFYNYVHDNIHLNGKGKNNICKNIIGTIYNKLHFNSTSFQPKYTRTTNTNPRSWHNNLQNTESSYNYNHTRSNNIVHRPSIQYHSNFPPLRHNRQTNIPRTHHYQRSQSTHANMYNISQTHKNPKTPHTAPQTHPHSRRIQSVTQNYCIPPPPPPPSYRNTLMRNVTGQNFRYVLTTLV
ncbi:hypothetical protein M8J77_007949 [Diaphorina citri]|nr:hypothetical protein M8J77_007949 [Diaphorina citri]